MNIEALRIDREALLAQTLQGAFPDARGRFGPFGGRYVPETLVPALDRLEQGIREILPDAAFKADLDEQLRTWVGRPTPLTFASELSRRQKPSKSMSSSSSSGVGLYGGVGPGLEPARFPHSPRMSSRFQVPELVDERGRHGPCTADAVLGSILRSGA